MKSINTIIFDFGGVLIDWNPRYLYRKIFDSETKIEWFLENVCRYDWNLKQDAGRDINEAVHELLIKFPEYEFEINAYYRRWEEMLGGPIAGSVSILKNLKAMEKRLLGLTNWSHQTFPIARERFGFLDIFEGIVVSGHEKIIKPDQRIYEIIIDRFDLEPEKCVFIDDSEKNIKAAKNIGMQGIVFRNPKQLLDELQQMDILLSG